MRVHAPADDHLDRQRAPLTRRLFATPFVVSSLGFLAARRRRNIERLAALLGEPPAAEGAVG